jgi:hypothetical protein
MSTVTPIYLMLGSLMQSIAYLKLFVLKITRRPPRELHYVDAFLLGSGYASIAVGYAIGLGVPKTAWSCASALILLAVSLAMAATPWDVEVCIPLFLPMI